MSDQPEREVELLAEVEHWKHHAWEAGEGFKRAIEAGNRAHAYRRSAEAERNAAQERLRAVEVLAGDERVPEWVRKRLAALASPVESDTEVPPSIGDTCCGKCPGGTCYVDGVTGA